MNWSEALQQDQALRDRWSEAIYRFVFGSIRRLGAFNADPHPGNYVFHQDGSVTFLDFGCVKRFDADQVVRMVGIIKSLYVDDREALRNTFIDLGVFEADHCPPTEDLVTWYSGPFDFMNQPQPFTLTPEWIAGAIAKQYSPTGPSGQVVAFAQHAGRLPLPVPGRPRRHVSPLRTTSHSGLAGHRG